MKIGIPSARARPIDSIESQRESIETLMGQRGDPLDKAVTYRDLVDGGFASVQGAGILSGGTGGLTPKPQPPGGLPAPPVPSNLQATGGFSVILLDWQYNAYTGHSHTEIWRATTDNLGNALLIGTTAAKIYSDYVTATGTTYYYWVRNVSVSGETSAFNATAGTPASISVSPAYLIDLLTGEIGSSLLNAELGSRITSIETTNASIETQIDDLYETFGNSQSSADNLAAAQAAAQAAIDAKVEAIGAKDTAVQAKVDAIAAKDGSIVAKDAAVVAQTSANTSANNASSSANNALTYSNTAATHAGSASTAANAATAARTAAESANTAAQTASAAAATSATNASTFAGNASTAATAATNAKIAAESARDSAQTSAGAAATSASTATTAATDASSAATSATTAKNAAEAANAAALTSANSAAQSASSASGYADESEAASAAATQSKLDAQAARDNAASSASAANTSASNANASANAASSSAGAANTSRIAAETARDASIAAKDLSVAAKNSAEIARNEAVSAKEDAESAEAAAATSQSLAADSALDAGGYASAAAGSASTAATKATEASNSATAADASKISAESARDAANASSLAAAGHASTAETEATASQNSANAASGYAVTAQSARDAALGYKDSAKNFADAASTSASTASTKAGDAGEYALAASNSASTASTSAGQALSYRNQAAEFASDAEGYASASAQDYSAINARLNNFGGSGVTVEQNASATASTVGGLTGQYTVKIDNNGYVSGFGLASTNRVDENPFSEFIIRADRFSIGSPGQSDVIPFIVQATQTVIGNQVVPAGVYINDAFIRNGTINSAKIADLAVDNGKIANLSADKITAGTIDAARIALNTNVLTSEYSPALGKNVLQITGGAITNDLIATNANIDGAKIGTLNVSKLTGDVTKYVTASAFPSGPIPVSSQTYLTMTLPKSTHTLGHKPYAQVLVQNTSNYVTFGYVQIFAAPVGDGAVTPNLGPIYPISQDYLKDGPPEFPQLEYQIGWSITFSGDLDIQVGDTITANTGATGTVFFVSTTGSTTTISVENYTDTLGSFYTRSRETLPVGQVGTYTQVASTYWDANDMFSVVLFAGMPTTTREMSVQIRLSAQYSNKLYVKQIDALLMGIR